MLEDNDSINQLRSFRIFIWRAFYPFVHTFHTYICIHESNEWMKKIVESINILLLHSFYLLLYFSFSPAHSVTHSFAYSLIYWHQLRISKVIWTVCNITIGLVVAHFHFDGKRVWEAEKQRQRLWKKAILSGTVNWPQFDRNHKPFEA